MIASGGRTCQAVERALRRARQRLDEPDRLVAEIPRGTQAGGEPFGTSAAGPASCRIADLERAERLRSWRQAIDLAGGPSRGSRSGSAQQAVAPATTPRFSRKCHAGLDRRARRHRGLGVGHELANKSAGLPRQAGGASSAAFSGSDRPGSRYSAWLPASCPMTALINCLVRSRPPRAARLMNCWTYSSPDPAQLLACAHQGSAAWPRLDVGSWTTYQPASFRPRLLRSPPC
jgi:hypothetical protein